MKKHDFFLAACKAGEYRRRAWVISAFSTIHEGPEDWKKDPYPYRIVQLRTGYFFVNPENVAELIPLEDCDPAIPPFDRKEKFLLHPGDIPNYSERETQDLITSYGQYFFNWVMFAYPFEDKIRYQSGRISPDDIEKMIIPRLKDDPTPNAQMVLNANERVEQRTGMAVLDLGAPSTQPIYVKEYLVMADAAFYLAGFTQLWVPAATRKVMTAPPGIAELKAKLLEQYKDRLHDPAVIAKIDAELIKYDSEYLKGDEGEGFLIDSKGRKVVRRKLFLMTGAEAGLGDGINVDLIQNSLSEGWDIEKFPIMNDTLRAGSYNRGAETMLGGEAVKWLLRASSNMMVTQADCGTNLGVPVVLGDGSKSKYMGFNVVTNEGHETLTEESFGKYLGQKVMVRSPMFCRLEKTDYCAVCVGPRLAMNPTALSSAVSEYGSKFMLLFMKKMHGTQLALAHMDYRTAIQ
jgi:hypothetical protein